MFKTEIHFLEAVNVNIYIELIRKFTSFFLGK